MSLDEWWARVWALITSPEWLAAFVQSILGALIGTVLALAGAFYVLRTQLKNDRALYRQQIDHDQELFRKQIEHDRQLFSDQLEAERAGRLAAMRADVAHLVGDALRHNVRAFEKACGYGGELSKAAKASVIDSFWFIVSAPPAVEGAEELEKALWTARPLLGHLPQVRYVLDLRERWFKALAIIYYLVVDDDPEKFFRETANSYEFKPGEQSRLIAKCRNLDRKKFGFDVDWNASFVFRDVLAAQHRQADALTSWDGYMPLPGNLDTPVVPKTKRDEVDTLLAVLAIVAPERAT